MAKYKLHAFAVLSYLLPTDSKTDFIFLDKWHSNHHLLKEEPVDPTWDEHKVIKARGKYFAQSSTKMSEV